jgi:hypothetical protein
VRGKFGVRINRLGILNRARRPARASRRPGLGEVVLGRGLDERDADLAPARIGHAEHRGLADAVDREDRRLHLRRVDVLAAALVHLFGASAHPEEALASRASTSPV